MTCQLAKKLNFEGSISHSIAFECIGEVAMEDALKEAFRAHLTGSAVAVERSRRLLGGALSCFADAATIHGSSNIK